MSIEALKRIVAAVDAIPEDVEGWMPDDLTDSLIDAKKAIARAERSAESTLEAAVAEQHKKQSDSVEPVAWCRYEDGMWVYYETKAWDDLQPLYTHPYIGQPRSNHD